MYFFSVIRVKSIIFFMKTSHCFVVQIFLLSHLFVWYGSKSVFHQILIWCIHHKLQCIHRMWSDGYIVHYNVSIISLCFIVQSFLNSNTSLCFVKLSIVKSIPSLHFVVKQVRIALYLPLRFYLIYAGTGCMLVRLASLSLGPHA